VVLVWSFLSRALGGGRWPRAAALAATALVPLVLATPVLYALFPALAPMGMAVAVFAVVALLLGVLVPHLQFLGGERRWVVPASFAALALVFFVGELANSGFSADQPRPNQIQYTLDADTSEALWQSAATKSA
jgi:hypothetical protein